MAEKLIRPVNATIQPENIGIKTATNNPSYRFTTPSELGLDITFQEGFINSEVYTTIVANDSKEGVTISINTSPYVGFRELCQAWTIDSTGVMSIKETVSLPVRDPLRNLYAIEKPRRLQLVEDKQYRYIVGEKKKEVFIDGWTEAAQAPKFRISIPKVDKGMHAKVDVSSAKLLIFD